MTEEPILPEGEYLALLTDVDYVPADNSIELLFRVDTFKRKRTGSPSEPAPHQVHRRIDPSTPEGVQELALIMSSLVDVALESWGDDINTHTIDVTHERRVSPFAPEDVTFVNQASNIRGNW